MIDVTTKQPLRVFQDGSADGYIMVAVSQLDEVRTILDAHHIAYWVDEEAVSVDDEPEIAVINLGQGSDAAAVQRLLDRVG